MLIEFLNIMRKFLPTNFTINKIVLINSQIVVHATSYKKKIFAARVVLFYNEVYRFE